MTRKLCYIGYSYLIGLLCASFFSKFTNILIIFMILALIGILLYYFRNSCKKTLIVLMSACMAFTANVIYTTFVYEKALGLNNITTKFEGEVLSIKQYEKNNVMYEVKGKTDTGIKATVLIYCTNQGAKIGDNVNSTVSFSEIESSLVFNAKSYYKAKGIFLTGKIVDRNVTIIHKDFSIKRSAHSYSRYIYNRITTVMPTEEGRFMAALVCGDKSSISSETQNNLYRCGIGHILSVSGIHLMVLSALVYCFVKKLRLNKILRFVIMLCFVIFFSMFSGLSVSILRAAVMLVILSAADIFNRRADTVNSIAIAGLVLTIMCPIEIRSVSFLLSFAGTLGLCWLAPLLISLVKIKNKYLKKLTDVLLTAISPTIATFIIVCCYFDEVSLIAPISNILLGGLLTIPLVCSFVVVFTGGISLIAYPILMFGALVTRFAFMIANLLSKIPLAYFGVDDKSTFIIVAMLTAFFVLIISMFKRKKYKLLSLITAICLNAFVILSYYNFKNAKITMIFINMDKSCCLLLNNNESACIININGNGQVALACDKYIKRNNIKRIDALVLEDKCQKSLGYYLNDVDVKPNRVVMVNEGRVVLPFDVKVESFNENSTIDSVGFSIYRQQNNVFVKFGDFVCSLADSDKASDIIDMTVRYDDNILKITCDGKLIDVYNNSFIEIKIDNDNKCSFGRINNAFS